MIDKIPLLKQLIGEPLKGKTVNVLFRRIPELEDSVPVGGCIKQGRISNAYGNSVIIILPVRPYPISFGKDLKAYWSGRVTAEIILPEPEGEFL